MREEIHTKSHESVVTVERERERERERESYSILSVRKKDNYKKLYKLIMEKIVNNLSLKLY